MNCVSCIICRAHVSYVVLFLLFCPLCVGFFSFSVFSVGVPKVGIGRVCSVVEYSRECCHWGSACACVMCAGDM